MLVEDDNVDAMTVKRALRELKVASNLARAVNGEEALEYLRNPANETPCVILLDLNMPRMNGIEFLKIVKAVVTAAAWPINRRRLILFSFDVVSSLIISK